MPKTMRVKTMGSYLSWISVILDRTPLHVLTCYIEPQAKDTTEVQVKNILYAIDQLHSKAPNSKL